MCGNNNGAALLDGGAPDRGFLARLDASGQVRWARLHDLPECMVVDAADRLALGGTHGVSVETGAGEPTVLLPFAKDDVHRVTDCRLDGDGVLYVAGTAVPGATLGGVRLGPPLLARKGTARLGSYEEGFVARLAL